MSLQLKLFTPSQLTQGSLDNILYAAGRRREKKVAREERFPTSGFNHHYRNISHAQRMLTSAQKEAQRNPVLF